MSKQIRFNIEENSPLAELRRVESAEKKRDAFFSILRSEGIEVHLEMKDGKFSMVVPEEKQFIVKHLAIQYGLLPEGE